AEHDVFGLLDLVAVACRFEIILQPLVADPRIRELAILRDERGWTWLADDGGELGIVVGVAGGEALGPALLPAARPAAVHAERAFARGELIGDFTKVIERIDALVALGRNAGRPACIQRVERMRELEMLGAA